MSKRKALLSVETDETSVTPFPLARTLTRDNLPPASPQAQSPSALPVPGAWPRETSDIVHRRLAAAVSRPSAAPAENSGFVYTIKRWATTLRSIKDIALLPARHVKNYFFPQRIRVETIERNGMRKKRLIDAGFARSPNTPSPSQRARDAKKDRSKRRRTSRHTTSSTPTPSSSPTPPRHTPSPLAALARNAWSTFSSPPHTNHSPSPHDASHIGDQDAAGPLMRDYKHKARDVDIDIITEEQATKVSALPISLTHDDEAFVLAPINKSSNLRQRVPAPKRKLRRGRGITSFTPLTPQPAKARSPKHASPTKSPELVDFKSPARVSKPATPGHTEYRPQHAIKAIISATSPPAEGSNPIGQHPQGAPVHSKDVDAKLSPPSTAQATEPIITEHASHSPEHVSNTLPSTPAPSIQIAQTMSQRLHQGTPDNFRVALSTPSLSGTPEHVSNAIPRGSEPRDGASISPRSHIAIIGRASLNPVQRCLVANKIQAAMDASDAAAAVAAEEAAIAAMRAAEVAEAQRLQELPPVTETWSEELSFLSDASDVSEDDSVPAGGQPTQVHWASHSSVRQYPSEDSDVHMLDVESQRTASSPPPHSRCTQDADEQSSVQEQPQVDDSDDDGLAAAVEAALSEEVDDLQEGVWSEPVVAPTPSPPKVVLPLVTPLDATEKGRLDEAARATGYGVRSDANVAPRITAKDFGTLLPALFKGNSSAWLNDEIVNGYLDLVVKAILKEEGHEQKPKGSAPRVHAFSSFWMKSFAARPEGVRRWAAKAHLDGVKYLDADLVLYPICEGNHWRLLAVKPKERTIEYLDSLAFNGGSYINSVLASIQTELDGAFKRAEWTIVQSQRSCRQLNGSDCGVFVLLNALALLRGEGVERVVACNGMQDARERIALSLITREPTLELA